MEKDVIFSKQFDNSTMNKDSRRLLPVLKPAHCFCGATRMFDDLDLTAKRDSRRTSVGSSPSGWCPNSLKPRTGCCTSWSSSRTQARKPSPQPPSNSTNSPEELFLKNCTPALPSSHRTSAASRTARETQTRTQRCSDRRKLCLVPSERWCDTHQKQHHPSLSQQWRCSASPTIWNKHTSVDSSTVLSSATPAIDFSVHCFSVHALPADSLTGSRHFVRVSSLSFVSHSTPPNRFMFSPSPSCLSGLPQDKHLDLRMHIFHDITQH